MVNSNTMKVKGCFAAACTPFILKVLFPFWLYLFITFFRSEPIDFYFARPLYLGAQQWYATGSFFFTVILHKSGKYLPDLVCVPVLFVLLLSLFRSSQYLKNYRKVCLYVIVSILACVVGVCFAKYLSTSFCPNKLAVFGGDQSGLGRCFPAGHATSGFCLFSLYFAFCFVAEKRS